MSSFPLKHYLCVFATLFGLVSLSLANEGAQNPFKKPVKAKAIVEPTRALPQRLERMELTGIMSFGGEYTFSLFDAVEKRSYWIALNESNDGIRISDFDESTQEVTVRFNALERKVGLNSNSIVTITVAQPSATEAASPSGASAGVASKKVARKKRIDNRSEEVKRKEEEARWLVSDLLSIGMEEREKRRAEREKREKEIQSRLANARREKN